MHCFWLFQVADVPFWQHRVDIEYFDSWLSVVCCGTPGFHASSLASLGFHSKRGASGLFYPLEYVKNCWMGFSNGEKQRFKLTQSPSKHSMSGKPNKSSPRQNLSDIDPHLSQWCKCTFVCQLGWLAVWDVWQFQQLHSMICLLLCQMWKTGRVELYAMLIREQVGYMSHGDRWRKAKWCGLLM